VPCRSREELLTKPLQAFSDRGTNRHRRSDVPPLLIGGCGLDPRPAFLHRESGSDPGRGTWRTTPCRRLCRRAKLSPTQHTGQDLHHCRSTQRSAHGHDRLAPIPREGGSHPPHPVPMLPADAFQHCGSHRLHPVSQATPTGPQTETRPAHTGRRDHSRKLSPATPVPAT
jgi:hypothetical protein